MFNWHTCESTSHELCLCWQAVMFAKCLCECMPAVLGFWLS